MTHEEILKEHPSLKMEQIVGIEEPTSENVPENTSKITSCSKLVWDHDQGNISVWRALQYVTVRVDHTRNGQWNGAVFVSMRPSDLIHFRQNLGGGNYDSFSC